jgi:hypothetical protein
MNTLIELADAYADAHAFFTWQHDQGWIAKTIEKSIKENTETRAALVQGIEDLQAEVEKLQFLRTKLKMGEYDGADIMQAWLAIDELLKLRAALAAPQVPAPTWNCRSCSSLNYQENKHCYHCGRKPV